MPPAIGVPTEDVETTADDKANEVVEEQTEEKALSPAITKRAKKIVSFARLVNRRVVSTMSNEDIGVRYRQRAHCSFYPKKLRMNGLDQILKKDFKRKTSCEGANNMSRLDEPSSTDLHADGANSGGGVEVDRRKEELKVSLAILSYLIAMVASATCCSHTSWVVSFGLCLLYTVNGSYRGGNSITILD